MRAVATVSVIVLTVGLGALHVLAGEAEKKAPAAPAATPPAATAPAPSSAAATAAAAEINDYPTIVRGDYIYGCMLVNGGSRTALEKCACSIDAIAAVLPYKEYEEAETILSVRQRGGENVAHLFTPASREKVNNLRRAQIEGEIRCF